MCQAPEDFNKSKYRNFVIVADIGGTHTTIAVYGVVDDKSYELVFEEQHGSSDITEFYVPINQVLQKAHETYNIQIADACFAMAGPTEPDRSYGKLTNQSWSIDVRFLLQHTLLQRILLLNDLESIGFGVPLIEKKDRSRIVQLMGPDGSYTRPVEKANCCIIAPGTGLGTGILTYSRARQMYIPVASEAGHVDIPASTELQWKLLNYLVNNVTDGHHPGYERVVSGQGIVNIYEFLRKDNYEPPNEIVELIDSLDDKDKPAAIQKHFHNSRLCHKCMDMFMTFFAKRCRNMALTTVSYGGVYLAGGIPAKLIDELQKPPFMKVFQSVDRMGTLIRKIPVYVVKDYGVNLLGCCNAAVNFMDMSYNPS